MKYQCVGFNFKDGNGYLLGRVSEIHSLTEWIDIVYPNSNAQDFFAGDTEKMIANYLYQNAGIKLEKYERRRNYEY